MIEADGLVYQDIDAMKRSVQELGPHLKNFEASCFDGVYITGDVTPEYLNRVERSRNAPRTVEEGPRNQLSLAIEPADA